MQQTKSQVMAAPVKTPGLAEGFGTSMGEYLDNPYKEFDTFKDNAFGKYDESAGILGNLKNNPLGSTLRLGTNWFGGYVPNLVGGTVEATKGIYNLDPSRALKGVGTAALGGLEGAITYGTLGAGGAIPQLLKAPGRALASGAKTVLPAAYQKSFQSGIGKGISYLGKGVVNAGTQLTGLGLIDSGANKLGLGNPADFEPSAEALQDAEDTYMSDNTSIAPGGFSFPGGFNTPQPQQRWDSGLSPTARFAVMNQAQDAYNNNNNNMYKGANTLKEKEYPDIRKFMKNPPPPGEYIPSPIPILQAGFKQHEFDMPKANQQGYGPIGDFIRQLIFQVGLPMVGIRNPMEPDFARSYSNLRNNQAYKFNPPNSF